MNARTACALRKLRQTSIFLAGALALSAQAGTPPTNDSFASRTSLSGQSVVVSTYNTNATTEPGEPSPGHFVSTKSLWWTWTAPYTGWANFSTYGSGSPLALGVYVGNSLKSLSAVGVSNATPWTLRYYSSYPYYYSYEAMRGDTVNVPVRSGETYQIVVATPVFPSDSGAADRVVLGINQPPAILSNGNVFGEVSKSLSYQVSASNAPTEYSARGLPPGLTLDVYTGQISGTPTTTGVFDATIAATNPGGTGSATVRFEIAEADSTAHAPEFYSGQALQEGIVGTGLSSYSISAKNTPTEFTADPLPPGLTWSASSLGSATAYAYPTGTPTQAGVSKATVRATNAAGAAEAYLTFRIREKPPLPVLQSDAVAYGKVGTSFSYSLYGANLTGGTYECGPLPAGLQMSTSGYISGTPTETGAFEIPVKVTNATGSTTGTLTLSIAAADAALPVKAPVITSPAGANGNVGASFYYAANANTPDAQYSASGLPDGLTINPTTGLISGSPKASGNYTATITASNDLGTSTSTLTLSIGASNTFAFSSPAMATGTVGKSFSYALRLSPLDPPYSYYSPYVFRTTVDASKLPPGLNYIPSYSSNYPYYYNPIGSISGTPTAPGIYRVPISTSYQNFTTSGTLTIVISATLTQAPVITSAASAQGNVGQSFYYSISASNYTESYSAGGLPAGLSLDASTGRISGTPTQAGTSVVTLTAKNSVGTGQAKLTISIGPPPKGTFYSNAVFEGTVGSSLSTYVSYSNSVSGTPVYTADGLPAGLQMSATGYISGTPIAAGTYPVTFSVSNAGGTTSIVQTFIIHDAPMPPVLTSDIMAKGNVGASFSYYVYTSGAAATYEFGELPSGLTASGGTISGTPTQTGTYEVPIMATNAGGSTTGLLTLQIDPPVPPTISVAASALALRGQNFSKSFYASNATSTSISGKLPEGITFNAQNLQLTGTPTENGAFPLEITVSGPGGTATVPFTLFVAPPPLPVITSSLVANMTTSSYSYFYADNNPTAFSAQRLPGGLAFYNQSSYAYAYGSLSSSGLLPATITASNFTGSSSAIVHFTSNSNLADYYFGDAMAEGVVNETFSYTLYSGSNTFMTSRSYSATNLPPGLAIDSATGKITGTLTTAGTYAVSITASHSSYAPLTFTLMIRVKAAPELPVITASSVIAATVGQSMSSWIYTSGKVTSFGLDPVPPGLTFDTASGQLSGTPTAAGDYKVKVSATNAAGSRTAAFLIQIAANKPAPSFYSDLSMQGIVGESFSGYLSASNTSTYAALGLPPGITLNPASGALSGTPTTPGSYLVEVQATNAGGTTTAMLALDVLDQRIPVISSYAEKIGAVGDSLSYTISASHAPNSFTATNLPPGLSLDSTKGTISGIPTQAGVYLVPITASNAAGAGAATLTLRIQPINPGWLSSAAAAQGLMGEKLSVSFYASQPDSTISIENLPAGLTFSTGSPKISGIPLVAGSFEIPVHVKRGDAETTSIFSLRIDGTPSAPPVINSPLTAVVGDGSPYTITASNRPNLLRVSTLPEGLTFDPSTGSISGTPKTSSVTDLTIFASNALGTSTATVKLVTIAPATPVIATSANIYATANGAFAYPISLSTSSYSPFYPPYYPYSNAPKVIPATITVRGLPPGMFFDAATQQIEGTPAEPGDYPVELTASTALSETTTRITLHVSDTPSSATSSLQISSGLDLNTFGAVGSPFSLGIFPTGLATELTATDLPPGLTLEKKTGVSNSIRTLYGTLSGSPTKPGVYPVKFTFSNAEQSASATVTIVIPETPEPPAFSGLIAASGTVGKSFSYYIGDGSGYLLNNAASIYAVSGLPPGLSFDQKIHQITGAPTAAGRYVVPVSLTNAGGTTDATVVFTISDPIATLPQLGVTGSGLAASEIGYTGEKLTLMLTPDGSEITALAGSGLPAGLKLQQTGSGAWTLAGLPAETGAFPILLTATSAQGSSTIPFTLDIRQFDSSLPPPPADPTPTPAIPTDDTATPPAVVVNKPRKIETTEDHLVVRGRVLDFQRGCRAIVRIAGEDSWTKLHIRKDGTFKLRLADLPEGVTKVILRVTSASGKTRLIRLVVHRQQS
jgi:PKD repeat protein